jgi:hypothetical protein
MNKIGTPVTATLWSVKYRYENIDPPKVILAGDERSQAKHVGGELNLLTADPTGADLCEVAASVVLGAKLRPEHAFTLEHVHRCADLKGLALVEAEGRKPQ